MRALNLDELRKRMLADLGLDSESLELDSTEFLATALRRAAGLLCPCAAPTLVRAVLNPLDAIAPATAEVRELVEGALEALVAHGDLLELRGDAEDGARRLLFCAPPSFVARRSGAIILLGITPDQLSPLPEDFAASVEVIGHVRRIAIATDETRQQLVDLGLLQVSDTRWLRAPAQELPSTHLERLNARLNRAGPSSTIPGLTIIDPTADVGYSRGRWDEPRTRSGRFVGRRQQSYGADLWCYVELRAGEPQRLIDLPLSDTDRGCDEAWRLQMAVDAVRGSPQRFRVRSGNGERVIIEFFSPVPAWAQRRLAAIGDPTVSRGALFAYVIERNEIQEERSFLTNTLWMTERPEAE